jgi:hypothetical protein
VPRLLVLCRHPYHLHRREAQAWLSEQVETVLHRDELQVATLTQLRSPSSQSSSGGDWLVEFQLHTGASSMALSRGGALAELVADLRLLGMAPMVALADESEAVELRPR